MGAVDEIRHGARVVSQAAEMIEMMKWLHGLASGVPRVAMALTVAANPSVIVGASAPTVLTARPGSLPWER
jgi:hypothetical protein